MKRSVKLLEESMIAFRLIGSARQAHGTKGVPKSLRNPLFHPEKAGCLHGVYVLTTADEHLQASFLSFSRPLFSSRKARRSPAASSSRIHCS